MPSMTPVKVKHLIKCFGVNHPGFPFISYLTPIVQMRELRETCPGSAPTDAWKPEPVAHTGCLSLEFINLCSAEWGSGTG